MHIERQRSDDASPRGGARSRGYVLGELLGEGAFGRVYKSTQPGVGREVAAGRADRGIVLGGSGQGEQISANKVHGVRAALCNDLYTAEYSRRHNDANVLAMGARIVAEGLADEILRVWLTTDFEGGRHRRRVDEITALEQS